MTPFAILMIVFILAMMGFIAYTVIQITSPRKPENLGPGAAVAWPAWNVIGKDTVETLYEGVFYRLSLNLTPDDVWQVVLTKRTGFGWRVVSTEDYAAHRVAKQQWNRIYQLLPHAFDGELEDISVSKR